MHSYHCSEPVPAPPPLMRGIRERRSVSSPDILAPASLASLAGPGAQEPMQRPLHALICRVLSSLWECLAPAQVTSSRASRSDWRLCHLDFVLYAPWKRGPRMRCAAGADTAVKGAAGRPDRDTADTAGAHRRPAGRARTDWHPHTGDHLPQFGITPC